MTKKTIALCPHEPFWSVRYNEESQRLRDKLGALVVQLNHVGSTAIPGIKAKPILDMVLESEVFPPSAKVINSLAELDYTSRGESNVAGRWWFVKGNPRQFHLHWCPLGGVVAQSQIAFRDKLRNNPDLARQYEQIKIAAAPGQKIDSCGYANAKSAFITNVLSQ